MTCGGSFLRSIMMRDGRPGVVRCSIYEGKGNYNSYPTAEPVPLLPPTPEVGCPKALPALPPGNVADPNSNFRPEIIYFSHHLPFTFRINEEPFNLPVFYDQE